MPVWGQRGSLGAWMLWAYRLCGPKPQEAQTFGMVTSNRSAFVDIWAFTMPGALWSKVYPINMVKQNG